MGINNTELLQKKKLGIDYGRPDEEAGTVWELTGKELQASALHHPPHREQMGKKLQEKKVNKLIRGREDVARLQY